MKNSIAVLFLLIVHFAFLLPIIKPGLYQSHDGENHVARFGAYYKAFSDFQIPPRWAGDLNYAYGLPVFIFFYPLPGYIASMLHTIGFNLQDCFKIIMGLSFILAPVFFYLWVAEYFTPLPALVAALFYGLAPYHFLDLYVRGDIGEIVSFVFLPLIFLLIEKNNKKQKNIYVLLGGIFYALFVLSHNIMSLLFTFIIVGYIFLKAMENKKCLPGNLSMIFLGLCMTSFFWFPALYEGKYINSKIFIGLFFTDHFPSFAQLIKSPWGFGPDVAKEGGLSPQIGLLQVIVVGASVFLLALRKKTQGKVNKYALFWLGVFFFAIFMSISLSSLLWNVVPLLKQFQFPWRFTALSSFAAAVLAGFTFSFLQIKQIHILIVALLIFSSIAFTKVKGLINRPDTYYLTFPSSTYFHGEATTIWTEGEAKGYPRQSAEVIDGKGRLLETIRKSNLHVFQVTADTNMRILDNTTYFPGWQVKVDGKKVPVEFQDSNYRGLITFLVPKGEHNITIFFGESPVRLFSDIVSLLTVTLSIFLLSKIKLLYR